MKTSATRFQKSTHPDAVCLLNTLVLTLEAPLQGPAIEQVAVLGFIARICTLSKSLVVCLCVSVHVCVYTKRFLCTALFIVLLYLRTCFYTDSYSDLMLFSIFGWLFPCSCRVELSRSNCIHLY